uniref:G_PROTEIN_RECEP_F1_2 domain-containing protein n=1 Tax=Mesocestoides corti TaxID=53468 RepID=A0A5K3FFL0_MESCO
MSISYTSCRGNDSISVFLKNELLLHLDLSNQSDMKLFLRPFDETSAELAKLINIDGSFVRLTLLTFASSNCDYLHTLSSRDRPFTHLVQTCILPFFITVTIVTNTLLCITLNQPTMRTPTNFFLLTISLADLFTGLLPLPVFVGFLTNYFDSDLTSGKAYLTYYCTVALPTVLHTISIWLTVLLAVQRLIYVAKTLSVHTYSICQFRGVTLSVVVVVILALLYNLNNFLTTFNAGIVVCTKAHGAITEVKEILLKCTPIKTALQFGILLLRAFTVHIGPCLLLCVLTAYMLVALKEIAKKQSELLKRRSGMQTLVDSLRTADSYAEEEKEKKPLRVSRKRRTSNRDAYKTSRIMLVVLLLFLVVELPTTVLVVMYGILIAFKATPPAFFAEVREVCNLLIVFSYPCNFVIYFAMSKQFRINFASLVSGWYKRRKKELIETDIS